MFTWTLLIHQIPYSLEQQGYLYLAEVLSIAPLHYPYIIFLIPSLFLNIPYP
jgi:hypothetical protein